MRMDSFKCTIKFWTDMKYWTDGNKVVHYLSCPKRIGN